MCDECEVLRGKLAEKERDCVPRSRYDIACDQYNEAEAKRKEQFGKAQEQFVLREAAEARVKELERTQKSGWETASKNFDLWQESKTTIKVLESRLSELTAPIVEKEVEEASKCANASANWKLANLKRCADALIPLERALRQARAALAEANKRGDSYRDASEDARGERDLALSRLADVLDYARHTHRARYADGGLTDSCGDCGLDVRHEIHTAYDAGRKP